MTNTLIGIVIGLSIVAALIGLTLIILMWWGKL
jgi:hypothetical protein